MSGRRPGPATAGGDDSREKAKMDQSRTRWLVVSYYLNESGLACSNHIDDRLPVFEKKGIDIAVVSSILSPRRRVSKHVRVLSSGPSGLRFEARFILRKRRYSRLVYKILETLILAPIFPFYLLEKLIIRMDDTWSWVPGAVIGSLIACLGKRPDVIYSTGGPASAHIAAGLTARMTGIRWVAELQDPLIHSYCAKSRLEHKLVRWTERFICVHADRVIFVTQGALRATEARNSMQNRAHHIYPGSKALDLDPAPRKPEPHIRFAHFGHLLGCRNLSVFIPAIAALLSEKPEIAEVVRFAFFGDLGKETKQLTDSFPFPRVIKVNGRIPRAEAIREMSHSDVLVVSQGTDPISSETIPSKTYEYMQVGRPIFALVYRNEELKGMLNSMGHWVAEADDPAEIKERILQIVLRWRSGTLDMVKYSSPFTVERAVEELIAVANDR